MDIHDRYNYWWTSDDGTVGRTCLDDILLLDGDGTYTRPLLIRRGGDDDGGAGVHGAVVPA